MLVLRIPDPSIVLLVGTAGAGKTTFAARRFAPGEILSSDAFRARIAGDEADQRATKPAFAALHRALASRSRRGLLTVVDATNLHASARRAIGRRARAAGLPTVAIVLDVPLRTAAARNQLRPGRSVDASVVRQQRDLLDLVLARDALASEDHALVAVLDAVTADLVRIDRVPWTFAADVRGETARPDLSGGR